MKKLVSSVLALTMVLSLAACGNSASPEATTAAGETTAAAETTTEKVIEKPSKITVTCDGTVVKADDNAQAFYDALKEATGIDAEWDRPDHSGYKDYIGTLFGAGSGSLPDVVLLSAGDYATYAQLGYLWDMTDAWENSEVKASGRVSEMGLELFENSKVVGPDGEYHLYGWSPVQGNGCTTYVKQSWLDAAGITKLPTTWEEYYAALLEMKKAKSAEYVVSAAGLVGGEAPYVNYLPEFYQDAYPEFYEKNGQWVDGFAEPAMKAALERLAKGYADGILDPQIIDRTTSNARDLFYEDKFGVFTYWAGKWRNNLTSNIKKNKKYAGAENETLVTLAPIAEVGQYLNRIAPQWCITVDCKNPEGVFEYWLSKQLDGKDVQLLWEYGTHYTYENGTFAFTELESTGNKATYNHIDGLLKLGQYAADFHDGKDIGIDVASPAVAQEAQELFNANSKMAPSIKKSDAMTDNAAAIWTARKSVIADVAMGKVTADEGLARYQTEVGDLVKECLDSLN